MVPSAQPTTTSSWLSCIDIGFIPGVANPGNDSGKEPLNPLIDFGLIASSCPDSNGGARAAHTPDRVTMEEFKSTGVLVLSFSSPSMSDGGDVRSPEVDLSVCVEMNI